MGMSTSALTVHSELLLHLLGSCIQAQALLQGVASTSRSSNTLEFRSGLPADFSGRATIGQNLISQSTCSALFQFLLRQPPLLQPGIEFFKHPVLFAG